ncbi:MAG: iron-sulfur cluster assembly protein, partial [Luteibacter sp.]
MSQASETLVRGALDRVIDPYSGQPLGAAIRAVGVDGDRVSVDIQLGYPAEGYVAQAAADARA